MDKEYLLFDLDGTLTDPKKGITRSVQYSLKGFGISVEDADTLISFIGPPLRESYQKYYGFSKDEAERAVILYREYFSEQGIFENALYEGIIPMLQHQHEIERKIIIATSKPTIYAERILEHFDIAGYFSLVAGSELTGERSDKAEIIRYALEKMRVSETRRAVMIGDRRHDILGAKAVGVDSIGVLYGYGDAEELTHAGADYIARDVAELEIFLSF